VKERVTLSIRPVKLNKSVYFRVPSDIVDLIGLENDSQVTLTIDEKNDHHLLIYSILKKKPMGTPSEPAPYPLAA
jgi:antitoxin component of MazEF toxin-antitoxin module